MKPLRIEFLLEGPIALPDRPIHLDALLAKAALKEMCVQAVLEEEEVDDSTLISRSHDTLPLEKHTQDDQWVWKASMLKFDTPTCLQTCCYSRTFDIDQWMENTRLHGVKDRAAQFLIGAGVYKAYALNFIEAIVEKATAYCIGDPDFIRDLLEENIHSIGKHSRMGKGRIRSIDIKEDPAAEKLWTQRNLPARYPKPQGFCKAWGALASPYWNQESFTEVLVPTLVY